MAESTAVVMNQGTMAEARSIIWETIGALRASRMKPADAQAINNSIGKWLATMNTEMKYHELIGKTPKIAALMVAEDTQ